MKMFAPPKRSNATSVIKITVLSAGQRLLAGFVVPAVSKKKGIAAILPQRLFRCSAAPERKLRGQTDDLPSVSALFGQHLFALVQGHQVDDIGNDLSQNSDNGHDGLGRSVLDVEDINNEFQDSR